MKVQLEQLDLLEPWPQLVMKPGYHAVNVLVRLGAIPIGEVMMRPARKRIIPHRRLRKRIAQKHTVAILKNILREGFTAGPQTLMSFLPYAWPEFAMAGAKANRTRQYVHDHVLLPDGLPSPLREWVIDGESRQHWPLPAVTVAVCTRDREGVRELRQRVRDCAGGDDA